MQKLKFLIFVIILFASINFAQELRGTWLARDVLASKESISRVMDSLAANNFNVVYVNVWSRGYPLWKSRVFYNETGSYIDPSYTNRDILAEAVAEGHRAGLHVEAWFEYGFVGGWTGNIPAGTKGPIFNNHPDWVSQKQDGGEIDGSNFYWMIHTLPAAQNFLIGLVTEVCRNYDIDGVELDRIRYSSLQYGYDDYTKNLYKTEHNDSLPPTNYNDANWLRWRADKLNEFIARAYDSVKAISNNINVSNAPSLYSSSSYSSYLSFAQDWAWWVNNNKIDNVQVQSYVGSPSSFGNILDYIKTFIDDSTKIYPAFAISPNGTPIADADLLGFVTTTRQKGFQGNAIWYYTDLINYNKFRLFSSTVYNQKVDPPYTPANWREFRDITLISDTSKIFKTGNWTTSTIPGFKGNSIYADKSSNARLDYYFNIPVDGFYEVYSYVVTASNRNDSAVVYINDSSSTSTIKIINQTNTANKGWYKLGDFYLTAGRKLVSSATNEFLDSNKTVSADAMMIILNRKLSPTITSVKDDQKKSDLKKNYDFNLVNYPNPFNGQTIFNFKINDLSSYTIKIYNILGQEIFNKEEIPAQVGNQEFRFDSKNLNSGVYIVSISQQGFQENIKIVLQK
ncbi:MAG TPA: family 10 glycosylhydrolase [Ignavibacteriaceae bacterium]|nr:family 10 glycosylhydrolase [Ignavibacteriaceae bacterium]